MPHLKQNVSKCWHREMAYAVERVKSLVESPKAQYKIKLYAKFQCFVCTLDTFDSVSSVEGTTKVNA